MVRCAVVFGLNSSGKLSRLRSVALHVLCAAASAAAAAAGRSRPSYHHASRLERSRQKCTSYTSIKYIPVTACKKNPAAAWRAVRAYRQYLVVLQPACCCGRRSANVRPGLCVHKPSLAVWVPPAPYAVCRRPGVHDYGSCLRLHVLDLRKLAGGCLRPWQRQPALVRARQYHEACLHTHTSRVEQGQTATRAGSQAGAGRQSMQQQASELSCMRTAITSRSAHVAQHPTDVHLFCPRLSIPPLVLLPPAVRKTTMQALPGRTVATDDGIAGRRHMPTVDHPVKPLHHLRHQ